MGAMRQGSAGGGRARGAGPAGEESEALPAVFESPEPGAHPALRTGEAGFVWLSEQGELETDTRVVLSPNSTHALLGHGVVEALNRLPLELAAVGSGRDALIPQAVLDDASDVFYAADRKTYGAIWTFDLPAPKAAPTAVDRPARKAAPAAVGEPAGPGRARLRIDNREYQRTLARLQDLVRGASRAGFAVRLRI